MHYSYKMAMMMTMTMYVALRQTLIRILVPLPS